MPTTRKAGGRRGIPLLAAAALVALAVFAVAFASGRGMPAAGPPATPAGQQRTATAEGTAFGPAAMARSEPVSVDIPKIGAHSSLVPLGLNADNTVQVPPVSRPMQAGWYTNGPTPGEIGPAVVLGHVDGNKEEGIFFRLKELAPGDKVSIVRRDGSVARFVVTKVDQIPKDVFPTDVVYGDTAGPELRLITCGGSFDHTAHDYRDNIIVYATWV